MPNHLCKEHFQGAFCRSLPTWVLVLLPLVSCNMPPSPFTDGFQTSSSIIPLKRGNVWSYRTTLYDQDGRVTRQYYDSTEIIDDTLYHGEQWFEYAPGFVPEAMAVRDSGLYGRRYDPGFLPPFSGSPYLFLKYPVTLRQSFLGGIFGVDSF